MLLMILFVALRSLLQNKKRNTPQFEKIKNKGQARVFGTFFKR